ncbi:MAG: pyridoxal-phosphate dependent enzyme, partial [Acidobacteriaceae bacterium]|nr:pyridoxal-phosphate dependent enzyme [Acidobacteriaceae bacterium]
MNPVSGSSTVQHALQTRCITCGAVEDSPAADFRCTHCGELLEITYPAWTETGIDARVLKQVWDARRSSRAAVDRSGVWRYRELLPILSDLNNAVTIQEGNTPIYDLPRCAHSAGVDRLLAKHQGMNPTGSFKDTGMTAALSVAKEKRFDWVACASTGNTSASMSAYAARSGMKSLVLIPEGKIAWGK